MSVYRKDDNGNIKKIAGSLTQRINMHIFQTTHEFDTEKNEDNYIINESDAKPYISSIKDWTQYSINLSEPNESSNINIKLGSQTLKLINSVKNIEIGTLNGIIQCHTEKLDNNEIFLDGVNDYPAITFAENERQKSKNLFNALNVKMVDRLSYNENTNTFTYTVNKPMSSGDTAYVIIQFGYLDAGTYTVSFQSTSSVVDNENGYTEYIIGKLNQQGDYESSIVVSDQLAGYNTITFTINERLYVGMLWYYKRGWIDGDTPPGIKTLKNIQLEYGSMATDYQPYYGQITHNGNPAVEFAENERQKSKNLFDLNYNGTFSSKTETSVSKYISLKSVYGEKFTINTNLPQYSFTRGSIGDIFTNIIFNNLKPYTNYIISFVPINVTTENTSVHFLGVYNVQDNLGTKVTRTITTDENGRFNTEYGIWISAQNTTFTVSNVQIEEGTVATDYQPCSGQITHNGDSAVKFAESERQKSKNLIPYPYHDGNSIVSNGITFTVNNDQSISVSGSIIDHNLNAVMWLAWDMSLKAGTYRISDSSPGNDLGIVAQIGDSYYQKDVNNGTFTLSSDATAKIYLQVAKDSTKAYNDTVKFMLCEGTDIDWQPYNGEIIHEKEFHETLQNTPAIAFAESERQKSKNLCGLIDFEQTVNGVTIKLVSSSQTVILNGTATAAFDAMQTVRNMLPYVSNMQGEDLKATAYYVSGTKSDTAIAFISTLDNDDVFGDRSGGIALPDNNSTSINFPPSKNSTYNTLMLYGANGVSFTNYTFRIQIEKGQVTDWEYPHGPISHNKELDDVAVSNNAFDLSVANANSYQSVYDLLRVNKGVGNFFFAGNNFPSFLPPCPDDVWHGTGNIDQIVVKIDTNNLTKSLSMTLQGVNQNSPAYKLDAYFDGTYWRNSGWYRHRPMELIYDMSSSDPNINRGFSTGVKFDDSADMTNVINVDTTVYDYFIVTCKSRSNFYTGICNKPYPTIVGSNLYLGNSIVANNLLVSNTYIRPIDCYEWTSSWTNHKNDDDFVVTKIIGVK